jgi:hypothetical protein
MRILSLKDTHRHSSLTWLGRMDEESHRLDVSVHYLVIVQVLDPIRDAPQLVSQWSTCARAKKPVAHQSLPVSSAIIPTASGVQITHQVARHPGRHQTYVVRAPYRLVQADEWKYIGMAQAAPNQGLTNEVLRLVNACYQR